MENQIPKFHETFNPILEILKDGEVIHSRELRNKVIQKFYSHLPNELLKQETKSGENLIMNRINWGKSYLKKGGYLFYPTRGHVRITDKGKEAIKSNLSLNDVQSQDGLLNFYKEENGKLKDSDIQILNASPQDLIDEGVQKIELEVTNELLDKLKTTDPYYFEKVVLILLKKMGYGEYRETSKSNDGGIDGIINEDKLGLDKIYIQAKRYDSNKVREKDIRNFIGAMSGDTKKGIFVTTSEFDQKAITKAREAHHSIVLIDGQKLVKLMYEYSVGVQLQQTYEVKEIDIEFFEGQ